MGSKAWSLAGRELRGRLSSRLAIAATISLGGGAALGAAIAAYRTDTAYRDHVGRAEVADVTINPGVWSTDMDRAIRSLPGVTSVRSHTMFVASAAWTQPATIETAPGDEDWVLVVGSTDGAFVESDRPVVTEGSLPLGPRELFVGNGHRASLERAVGHRLHPGDEVDLAFWWSRLLDGGAAPGELVSPIAVEHVTVSGFGNFPDEILPDDLFPQEQAMISADLAGRYSCIATLSTTMTMDEVNEATAPRSCSSQYWFYSLDLAAGVTEQDVRSEFASVADRLNRDELPVALRDIGAVHFYIGQARSDLDEAVRRTTRPSVTALTVFAAVAGIATVAIVGLMSFRAARRVQAGHSALGVLGATRRQRAVWSALPLLRAAALGTAGACLVAAALSPIGPLGTVRSVQAGWSVSLPAAVVAPGLAAIVVLCAAAILVAAVHGARARTPASAEPGRASAGGMVARARGPAARAGLAAAIGTRRGGANLAVLAACAVTVACGVAAIVFGASLSRLVDEPRSFGWPWDVAVVTGGGYGSADTAAVEATLAEPRVRRDVVDVSYFAFEPSGFLGDGSTPVVFGFANAADTDLPILSGTGARRAGDVVVGSDTASRFGLHVGDRVTVRSTSFDAVDGRVVGIGVMPPAGQFGADRPGLGTGAFVLVDTAPGELVGMIGLRVADGLDPASVASELGDVTPWDLQGAPVVRSSPVRAPQIVDAGDLRSVPLVLGGVLVLSLGVGLGLSIAGSVRARSRELAILRVLGFTVRQVGASVRWQAAAVAAIGAAVGSPVGIVAGRSAWQRFARELGVERSVDLAPSWLGLYIAAVAVLALVAAVPAVRRASRATPARVLRDG